VTSEPPTAPDDAEATDLALSTAARATSERAPHCPRCGWVNDTDREMCRRCGADLDTGEELPQLVERPDPFEVGPVVPRRRSRWWLPVGAVLLGAAAVLGGLWVAGVGPFASAPEVPEADFDGDRYAQGEPEPLLLSHVATRTTAPAQGERSFEPSQLVDDDRTTAWRSDPAQLPETAREVIELYLETPAWVSGLVVANGDQHDDTSFEASGRLHRVRLHLDGGETLAANLLDQRGRQLLALEEPRLTTAIRLEVVDVFAGVATDAAAISDVELHGWPADAADTAVAQERATVRPAAGAPLDPSA
jgi:hypothetical protein